MDHVLVAFVLCNCVQLVWCSHSKMTHFFYYFYFFPPSSPSHKEKGSKCTVALQTVLIRPQSPQATNAAFWELPFDYLCLRLPANINLVQPTSLTWAVVSYLQLIPTP